MANVSFDESEQQLSRMGTDDVPRRSIRCVKTALVLGTTLAMVFSILIVSHCNFVTTDEHVLGLFNAAQYDENGNLLGCVSIYEDEIKIDGLFRNARAFGTITAFLTTASFVLLLYVMAFRPSKVLWNMLRFMLTSATMTSMFVFTIVGTSYCNRADCRLSGVGILNVFNVFLLSSLAVVVHIDKPPAHPIFTVWTDEMFTYNKDTLAVDQDGSFPEFVSHEDSRRIAQAHAADCASSVDMMELDIVDGRPQFAHSATSVVSEQSSIQESLMTTTINVQRSKCFRFTIMSMIILTWMLTIYSVRRCTFVMVHATADPSKKFGMGIFARAVYHEGTMLGCLSYPDEVRDDFSGAFKASRIFGTVTSFLMTIILLLGILQLFTTIAKEAVWLTIRALLVASLIFETFTFLAFKSNTCKRDNIECTIGSAGFITVINCILMLGLAVFSCVVPPPANPVFARWRTKHNEKEEPDVILDSRFAFLEQGSPMKSKLSSVQEELEETDGEGISQRKDEVDNRGVEFITVRVEFGAGEKRTIKEITHADGSKTVTTIVEEIADDDGIEDESTIASGDETTATRDDISLHLDPDVEDVKIIL